MSTEKRAFLVEHLSETAKIFEDAILGVEPAVWGRMQEGQWCIAQCAEHAVKVEQAVSQFVPAMATVPAKPYDADHCMRKDAMMLGVADRANGRVNAPERVQPCVEPQPTHVILDSFRQTHQILLSLAEEFPEWLRGRFREHPIFKDLDGYQWLLVASSHTRRHAKQIKELKQHLTAEATN